MSNPIIWTQELAAAAKAIAADTWTPPYWPETWESVQQRAGEAARYLPRGPIEAWQVDQVKAMRSRYQSFPESPASVRHFESLWAATYSLANPSR